MTGVELLGLLLLKHGTLAHVIDFGYSASRRSGYRFWVVALLLHCLAELVGTLFVLDHFPLQMVSMVVIAEFIGLSVTAFMERGAPLNKLLSRHLKCEVIVLVNYAFMASYLATK